ncbi:MAG TPA: MOSC N-terminal beta barrel domain-containing protein [Polyangiaceae bacterium]|nr:MOSC N-terminal beta barrel domain-containing protein [Polyangiaceae bacterium]
MQLTGLFVYPIKACAGVALQESDVVERGLAFDRRYLLVDKTGTFVTQREIPRLCLVQTAFEGERLLVSTAGKPTLQLPKEVSPDSTLAARNRREWRVWDDVGNAPELAEGSRWFSEFLNDDVSLLYMPDSERRAVNPKRARAGDVVSFADAYPLLLISEASLADLNRRLPAGTAPLEMRRFRPNLVISGCAPYAEDDFRSFRIGGLALRGVKRCERCVVTTVNPDTAEQGSEPLRTLSHYRKDDEKVWFGMNLIHEGSGTLRVGDAVLT